jgi:hypothetical protein
MYLLYVDESGSPLDDKQRYFILAGLAVFERDTHWIERDMDDIVRVLDPDGSRALELHGSQMLAGRGPWRSIKALDRERALQDALIIGVRQRFPKTRLFAAVLDKQNYSGRDVVEEAFQQIVSRFDQFLGRLHKNNNTQRGLMIFDRCKTERRMQTLAREFKTTGHAFGKTRNLAEVPLFVDSDASRLLQAADLVNYSLSRHFERSDSRFFDLISHCFDSEGRVNHGLYCG